MAGSRTLKLSILADVDDLRKKLGQGSNEVQTFGDRVTKFGKVAGAAFAAAGVAAAAYAGKLLVDGVKSAIEDEKAQSRLANTLNKVTGATKAQVAAVEDFITKQGQLFGVTDEQLRPAMDRLVRATGDVAKAQNLASLAMDISASTGKDLQTVSNALAKAQEGNVTSLARLTGGFDTAFLKGKDLSDLMPTLQDRFAGAAEEGANTFAGKMARLSLAFDEAKETVGGFILDAITPILSLLVTKLIPAVGKLSTDIGKTLQPVFEDLANFFTEYLIPLFKEWWDFITNVVIPGVKATLLPILEGLISAWTKVAKSIKDNESNLKPLYDVFKAVADFVATTLAPAIGKTLGGAFSLLGSVLSTIISAFSSLVGLITAAVDRIKEFAALMRNNPITNFFSGASIPSPAMPSAPGGNTNFYQVSVNGAIDPVGTARTIQNLLNSEATLSGNFIDGVGTSRFAAAV